jgi:hypothetical protein
MLVLRVILLIVCLFSLPKGWHTLKGPGKHLLSTLLLQETQPPIRPALLAQSFSYWKKGGQFYVFLSEDQKIVLKIPRALKMGQTLLRRIRAQQPSGEFLTSMKAASQFLVEETALLYAHYGSISLEIPSQFILLDCFGRSIPIDLARIPFILQTKQELLSSALEKESSSVKRKEMLLAFLDLILREQKKGWMSVDKSFRLNISYEKGRAWRIDVGSYAPLRKNFSLKEAAKPVCHWLRQQDPELLPWFEQELVQKEFVGA